MPGIAMRAKVGTIGVDTPDGALNSAREVHAATTEYAETCAETMRLTPGGKEHAIR